VECEPFSSASGSSLFSARPTLLSFPLLAFAPSVSFLSLPSPPCFLFADSVSRSIFILVDPFFVSRWCSLIAFPRLLARCRPRAFPLLIFADFEIHSSFSLGHQRIACICLLSSPHSLLLLESNTLFPLSQKPKEQISISSPPSLHIRDVSVAFFSYLDDDFSRGLCKRRGNLSP
jgi:hypothetical protein